MNIALANDHAGHNLMQTIITHLTTQNIAYTHFGCTTTDPVDYTDPAIPAAEAVANTTCDKGILICGTGLGMSIIANKVKGIRASLCHTVEFAKLTRQHNDANILVLAGRFTTPELAVKIVDTFLTESFSQEERHQRRIDKITNYDNKRG